jgi:hypothetical protein
LPPKIPKPAECGFFHFQPTVSGLFHLELGMASQSGDNVDKWNESEVVTIRGERYVFGLMEASGMYAFIPFKVNADFSLTSVTLDSGISLEVVQFLESEVTSFEELLRRVRELFIPRLNLWLKKRFPGAGQPTTVSPQERLIGWGNQVAGMIKITDGPNGPTATL